MESASEEEAEDTEEDEDGEQEGSQNEGGENEGGGNEGGQDEGSEDDDVHVDGSRCDWSVSHLLTLPTAAALKEEVPYSLYKIREIDPGCSLEHGPQLSLEEDSVSMAFVLGHTTPFNLSMISRHTQLCGRPSRHGDSPANKTHHENNAHLVCRGWQP